MLDLFRRFRTRRHTPVRYSFYVWENGTYVQLNAGEFRNDWDASEAAQKHAIIEVPRRPASLDVPHLHVVREDGVHIITIDLPQRSEPSASSRAGVSSGFLASAAA